MEWYISVLIFPVISLFMYNNKIASVCLCVSVYAPTFVCMCTLMRFRIGVPDSPMVNLEHT